MKHIIWVLLVIAGVNFATAQDVYTSSGKPGYHKKTKNKKGYDPEKLILGGGLSANFGGGYILAGLSPIVGYRFTDNFSAGIGLGYLYFQTPDYDVSTPYTTYYDRGSLIYPNIWSKYFVWRNVYVTGTVEFDIVSEKKPTYDVITNITSDVKYNYTAESLLLGVGLKQPLGGRVSIFAQVEHEFLQEVNSPYYGQPIIFNIGVCAGL